MTTMTGPMTVDEFLALPEKEGVRMELSDGVLIEEEITLGNANPRDERVKANFNRILVIFADQHQLGEVFPESIFKMKGSAREPDVAFISAKRLIPGRPETYLAGAPDIAIEIVSSDKAAELERKIEQYFEGGAKFVWVAYPDRRVIRVCDPTLNARFLHEDQFLEAPDVLPGFRVSVSKFFEGL
ncbi:MAG: Uma2 family endonuclease [Acidobacteriota bacterium]|nr:Uma2 family endonuclease [Acidobacteriota bacterium]